MIEPDIEQRVRQSVARQPMMSSIGARIVRVVPGQVDVSLSAGEAIRQQHGFVHGGVLATICDSACGYAALTLMPLDVGVLAVEFKMNFLAPVRSDEVVARGRVIRAGGTLSFCAGDVFELGNGGEQLVATMTATMFTVRNRAGVSD